MKHDAKRKRKPIQTIEAVVLFFVILLTTSCQLWTTEKSSQNDDNPVEQSGETDWLPVSAVSMEEKEEYRFAYTQDYTLSLYEPPEGCYLGAYILSDKTVNYDIKAFETLMETKHAIYLYNMDFGSDYPENWVLSCIANGKIPYIHLRIKGSPENISDEELIKTAADFGAFYVPVFLQFGTITQETNPESYVETYRRAREIFREYASNVAFVWCVEDSSVYDMMKYYPGHEAVDWAGLEIVDSIDENGDYRYDIFTGIDYFYNQFQKDKPIMLAKLAVSHFSSVNHVYRTAAAAAELTRIYNKIAERYTRVKGILYLDFNGIDMEAKQDIRENFTLTSDAGIIRAYKEIGRNAHFLSGLDIISSGETVTEIFSSPFPVVKINDAFFLPEKIFQYDLRLRGLSSYAQPKLIDGQTYYDVKVLERKNIGKLEEDTEHKVLLLRTGE